MNYSYITIQAKNTDSLYTPVTKIIIYEDRSPHLDLPKETSMKILSKEEKYTISLTDNSTFLLNNIFNDRKSIVS